MSRVHGVKEGWFWKGLDKRRIGSREKRKRNREKQGETETNTEMRGGGREREKERKEEGERVREMERKSWLGFRRVGDEKVGEKRRELEREKRLVEGRRMEDVCRGRVAAVVAYTAV